MKVTRIDYGSTHYKLGNDNHDKVGATGGNESLFRALANQGKVGNEWIL